MRVTPLRGHADHSLERALMRRVRSLDYSEGNVTFVLVPESLVRPRQTSWQLGHRVAAPGTVKDLM